MRQYNASRSALKPVILFMLFCARPHPFENPGSFMPARTPQQSHPASGIARVAVPSPLRRLFDYLIPANTHVQPGIRVRVPFGSRELTGIIVAIVDQSDIETSQLRPITEVLDHDELIPSHLLDLWLWAANYYQHPVGDALHLSLIHISEPTRPY